MSEAAETSECKLRKRKRSRKKSKKDAQVTNGCDDDSDACETENVGGEEYTTINLSKAIHSSHCKLLLKNKRIVFMGDSVMRCIYKDTVAFSCNDAFLNPFELKKKGELKFRTDHLLLGGEKSVQGKTNTGANYREWRMYKTGEANNELVMSYHFITKAYNEYVARMIDFMAGNVNQTPDYLVINSAVWDLSRYSARTAMSDYEEDMSNLFNHVTSRLPNTILIWCVSPPVAGFVRGGFTWGMNHSKDRLNTLRYDMIEAKRNTYKVARKFPIQVVDLHHAIQPFDYLRETDGIHYVAQGTRMFTKQILYQMYLTSDEATRRNKLLDHFKNMSPAKIKPDVEKKDKDNLISGMLNVMTSLVCRNLTKQVTTPITKPDDIVYYVREEAVTVSSPPNKKRIVSSQFSSPF